MSPTDHDTPSHLLQLLTLCTRILDRSIFTRLLPTITRTISLTRAYALELASEA
jgi:hypothetical protein